MSTIDTADYKGLFVTTAHEHLQAVEALLQRFAQNDDPTTIAQEIFRHIHSLKGSSGMMGHKEMVTLCDEIDNIIHTGPDTFYIDPEQLPAITTRVSNLTTLLAKAEAEQ